MCLFDLFVLCVFDSVLTCWLVWIACLLVHTVICGEPSFVQLLLIAKLLAEWARSFPMECYCAKLGCYVDSRVSESACQPTSGGAEIQLWMGAQNRSISFTKLCVRRPKGSKSDPWPFFGGLAGRYPQIFEGAGNFPIVHYWTDAGSRK